MKTLNQSQPIYWTGDCHGNKLVAYIEWESLTPQNEIQIKFAENGKLIWVRLPQLQN